MAGTECQFELSTLRERIDIINAQGGAVTFDVPIASDGKMPKAVLSVLRELGSDVDKLRGRAYSY